MSDKITHGTAEEKLELLELENKHQTAKLEAAEKENSDLKLGIRILIERYKTAQDKFKHSPCEVVYKTILKTVVTSLEQILEKIK